MKLIGRVQPGQGLGAPRMADPAILELLQRELGFRPVLGTLNVMLPGAFDRDLAVRYVPATDMSATWQQDTGQAGYWLTPVQVAGRFHAIAVQADEPDYPPEQIELICSVRLRDALGLVDGDEISISAAEIALPEGLRLPSPEPGERWVVAAVIHDGGGRAFLQRRSPARSLFPDAWDLVGGHVEPGEGILDCLLREVSEETGWRVTRIVADLGTLRWTGDDGLERHEIDYLVEVNGDLAHPSIEPDLHLDPRWVTLSEAVALLDGSRPSDALVRPVVERAFAELAGSP